METAANQWMIENIFFARPLPLPLMLLAIGAVISWSVYLYRRSIGLSPVLRFTLGFTRFFVLSVVLAALCEPMIGLQETKTRKKTLPVLVDVSQSMGIRDPRKRPAHGREARPPGSHELAPEPRPGAARARSVVSARAGLSHRMSAICC